MTKPVRKVVNCQHSVTDTLCTRSPCHSPQLSMFPLLVGNPERTNLQLRQKNPFLTRLYMEGSKTKLHNVDTAAITTAGRLIHFIIIKSQSPFLLILLAGTSGERLERNAHCEGAHHTAALSRAQHSQHIASSRQCARTSEFQTRSHIVEQHCRMCPLAEASE